MMIDLHPPSETGLAAKELRKQRRRERIISEQGDGTSSEEGKGSCEDDEAKSSSDRQIEASNRILEDAQRNSSNSVTETRLRVDQRESKRRQVEEEDNHKRQELLKQLDDTGNDEAVASGWTELQSQQGSRANTNVADLCKLLDKQKMTCNAALEKLERIGNELGSELREMDNEYVIALKRNRREVELLQKCISDEHQKLKDAFERELKQIEESLTADRDRILQANRDELNALILQREQAEAASLDRQQRVIDEHRAGIEESESKAEQDREDLKKKLQSEVQRLEIELEDTRARHQFDTDKLEYNVRELTELSEDEDAVKKQKRRIMKGKEELNRELDEKHQAKVKGRRQNELLEADCERIEKQASGLKEKFERFKISDDEKYRAVLSMHKDDLRKLQDELKQSREFIFGSAIGGNEAAEQSCTSDVTWVDDVKSNKTNEPKIDTDEFGLPAPTGDKAER